MFVPYFLFLNVKFNGTVPPFEYQEILAPRIKGYPESHMPTQKDPRQINHPGPFLQNAPKQILLSSLHLNKPIFLQSLNLHHTSLPY